MKKLFFALVLIASAYTGKAQNPISFGPKAGVNFASWATKETPALKMRPAFHAGGAVTIPITSTLALQPELLYSKEGTKFDQGNYDMSYLDIPLLVRYNHVSGFHAETGLQLGILLDVTLTESGVEVDEENIKDYMRSTQGSWALGMGFQFKSGLDMYTRYNVGISRVGAGENKITGNVLSVGIAYMFRR